MPSFDEYIENACVSITLGTVVFISALYTGEHLTDHVLSLINHGSRFLHLVVLTGRLVNDTKTYQVVFKAYNLSESNMTIISSNRF